MEPPAKADEPVSRQPAHRYTYPEAAAILRVKQRWLQNNIKRLPHSKKGRSVTFSEEDLDAIDAMFHHQPPAPATRPPVASASTHPLASLKPLPSRMRRR
ncbi:helix-turn-helix domain-containing protein [Streptomyces chengmaiensis]|uniref:helix-turn-helix domain-containing protein n=1 Tax=Streptomyces chengmaiensis TaxID=3040919 RepID=UPI0037DA2B15